jgi:hypothetical protein
LNRLAPPDAAELALALAVGATRNAWSQPAGRSSNTSSLSTIVAFAMLR